MHEDLLDLAERAARAAGELLLQRPDVLQLDTKSSKTDIVTQMDRASEELIASMIRAERPDDGFIGEEGANTASKSGITWVIDPLDGTINYLYDLPGWAVSIAAVKGDQNLVGVVYVPRVGELFTAIKGQGAFCNGVRLRASKAQELDQALIATGFAYGADRRARQGAIVGKMMSKIRDIRRFGAAAVDLCHVAAGRVDGYFEAALQPWDLAAGELIAREAGAVVTGLRTERANHELVVAAPPAIHVPLRQLLLSLDADRV